MDGLRGAFSWVPKPVAREFWWLVLAGGLTMMALMGASGSPRTGTSSPGFGFQVGVGWFDSLGYWGPPLAWIATYLLLVGIRLMVGRIRGGDLRDAERELRAQRQRRRRE